MLLGHIIAIVTLQLLLSVAVCGLISTKLFYGSCYGRLKQARGTSQRSVVTSHESEQGHDKGEAVHPYEPDWPMMLDMCEISNLCDAEPAKVGQILKNQGRINVRV